MARMVQMLTEDEGGRLQEYANRWYKSQDVGVFSPSEREDMHQMLDKALVGVELAELGFPSVQLGRLHPDPTSSE